MLKTMRFSLVLQPLEKGAEFSAEHVGAGGRPLEELYHGRAGVLDGGDEEREEGRGRG